MTQKKIKVKWYVVLLWVLICWPVAIIYIIMVNGERKHQETLEVLKSRNP